jgi:MarR family transcriptional regulator, lower aerobic nicotinate degradation pathway regulator
MDETVAPRRLWELPSWLLNRAATHATRVVAEAFVVAGVRRHHFTVLVALDDGGPSSQADLGRRLGMDRSDLHAVVNDLEHDGLVSRGRDERDRRRNVVALTSAGRSTLRRLDEQVQAAQAELLTPLSQSERRDLERLLTRVVEHHAGRS